MKLSIKALALSGALAALAPLAHATSISIGLQEGGAIMTEATDASTPGYASFSGTFGTFNFNSINGTGYPNVAQGNLLTNSIQTSSTQAGTITVYITAQGLTSPTGATDFLSSFTSNTFTGSAYSVAESTLFGNSNELFGGTEMAAHMFTSHGSTPDMTSFENLTGVYSETAKYVITVNAGTASVNDTIDLSTAAAATPEPSSLILLGTGVLGAAGLLRRRFLGSSNA